jgi:hypothetical protein
MGPLIAREARCISTAQFTASTLKKGRISVNATAFARYR